MIFEYMKNENERIEIKSFNTPFLLKSYEGIDLPTSEISSTKNCNQDGEQIDSITLPKRPITIEGYIKSDNMDDFEDKLNFAYKVFKPKTKGILYCSRAKTRQISCVVERFHLPYQKNHVFQPFILYLLSELPFFEDIETSRVELTSWVGGFSFPLTLPLRLKTRGEPIVQIYNDGHVETPVEIIFRGPAEKPRIDNLTTGEHVAVNSTLLAGETLYINTKTGSESVEIERNGVRVNAYNYINLNSALDLNLAVGDNVLKYSSTRSDLVNEVEVRYRQRYLGV